MFEYVGWDDAARLVRDAVEETIASGTVTYDLHRNIEGGEKLATSEFADEICQHVETLA
jgi:isocitrate dehydrogenase